MFLASKLYKRCSLYIKPCIEEGYFSTETAYKFDERVGLIYHGMLSLMVKNRLNYSHDKATEVFMNYSSDLVELKILISN